MSTSIETSLAAVTAAHAAGDTRVLADTLLRHADVLLRAGRLADAAGAVDQAAGLQHDCGAVLDQARCLRMAATLQRLQGHFDAAKTRAQAALELTLAHATANAPQISADTGAARDVMAMEVGAAYAELGEIALAQSDPASALDAFNLALADGSGAPAARWRGRAKAMALAGRFESAAADLETAVQLLESSGDTTNALRVTVEAATAWQQARRFDRAQALVTAAQPRALSAGDEEALAGLALLSATDALERKDAAAARDFALAARGHALASRTATPYIGAAIALARIDEQRGDVRGAYAALATGWATVGDLIGAGLARAAFEPLLRGLRERRGVSAFNQARSAYEAERST